MESDRENLERDAELKRNTQKYFKKGTKREDKKKCLDIHSDNRTKFK